MTSLTARYGQSYDVVIVGGGHNGLVAATYLAQNGLSVLILEKKPSVGGAVAGAELFAGVHARMSQYSYLVSLLPQQLIRDLRLNVQFLSRRVASYTPTTGGERNEGLLVERREGQTTRDSFLRFTGSSSEYERWSAFYASMRDVAGVLAPTLTQPLPTREQARQRVVSMVGEQLWNSLFEQPLGAAIEATFSNDAVRGIVLTDALIGAHTHAHDDTLLQNRVFLYHTIGNGTGEWRVPKGGMGAVAHALERAATTAGAQVSCDAEVLAVSADDRSGSVTWRDVDGAERSVDAKYVLSNVAPESLQRLRGFEQSSRVEGSQLKINMLVRQLPGLRSGLDPRAAFSGTLHINESYTQLEDAYRRADSGAMPDRLPCELYCHTLTDPSILGRQLADDGWHTLTLFALHTPARLFKHDNAAARARATELALTGLNEYLTVPIESCLAHDAHGDLCIESKSPIDLQRELDLPGGNIFHGDLQWPFLEADDLDDPWGVATGARSLLLCGSGARRGGAVSGIGGHNASHAVLDRENRR